MNWKPTWVLLAAAAAMLAFIAVVERPLRKQRELQASHLILPGLDPALVTNIEIHPWGHAIIQAARAGGANSPWKLVKPISYPAQNEVVTALLTNLAGLEWADRLDAKDLNDRPTAQEDFGFTKPHFTILLQGSGLERRLEIGDLTVFRDQVHVQVVGNNAIYVIPTKLVFWLPVDKDQWRDRALLDPARLAFQTLRVRAGGNEFDLERDSTNHLWFMRKLSLVARADTPKIDELLDQLQTLSVSNFVTDDPHADLGDYGLQASDTNPALSLTFLDHTNVVAELQAGRGPSNAPALVFARLKDPNSVVAIAREPLLPWLAPYTNFLDQHFLSLSPSLVESIAVQGDDNFTVEKQTNGQWLVKAGGEQFPADAGLMEYWLAGLTNVPTEIVKNVVTEYSEYGLTNPALRYAVRFSPKAGERTEARIEFGTNQAGKVFEHRLGEDGVNTIAEEDYSRLPRISWQLRDRQVWNFASSNVVSVTAHQGGGTLKLLRDPEGGWTFAPGFASQMGINSLATEECVKRIGRLRAVYWDGMGGQNLERFGLSSTNLQLEFEVKHSPTNEIFRLQFGARSPFFHPYAAVTRNGRLLIFEFPADDYENLVKPNLTPYTARQDF
ncbi:MAG TPA: DUF4340 domain-containing protein [Verrucomicrobiae bacterium]|jgi:hypothetical protein